MKNREKWALKNARKTIEEMPKNVEKSQKIAKMRKTRKSLKMPKTPRVSGEAKAKMQELKGGTRAGNEDLEGIQGTRPEDRKSKNREKITKNGGAKNGRKMGEKWAQKSTQKSVRK